MIIGDGEVMVVLQLSNQVVAIRGFLKSLDMSREVNPVWEDWNKQTFIPSMWTDVRIDLATQEIVTVDSSVASEWGRTSKDSKPYSQPALVAPKKELDGH